MRGWRTTGAALGALVLMMGLSGCWPVVGQGPDRAAYNSIENGITPATVNRLTKVWTRPTAGNTPGEIVSSTSHAVATAGPRLYSLDLGSGQVAWFNDGSATGGWQTPGADGTEVTAVSSTFSGQSTTRFDEATGAVLGTTTAGRMESRRGSRTLYETAALTSGNVVTHAFSVVDAADPSGNFGGTYDQGVLASFQRLTLGAVKVYAAGQGLTNVSGVLMRANGVRSFFPSQGPSICAPFLCPNWSVPIDGQGATDPVLAPDESAVFTATDAGTVYAVDAGTGAIRWSAAAGAPVDQMPALANGVLYVAPRTGGVLAFAAGGCGAATCTPLYQFDTGSPVPAQPAVAGGLVFVGTQSGLVQAFPAAGCGAAHCAPAWSSPGLGGSVTAGPIVVSGNVLVGTFGLGSPAVVDFRLAPA
jgi:outer membrane protein assembly factor BamB